MHTIWTEFKSIEAVPKLTLGEGVSRRRLEGAAEWHTDDWKRRTGQGHRAHTKSCYSRAGCLDSIQFELRTDWGWYYKAEGPFVMNRFHRSTGNLRLKKQSAAGGEAAAAGDFPQIIIPLLYKRTKFLPFADLLEKRP